MGLSRKEKALKKAPSGAAVKVVQLADRQCAFRAQQVKVPYRD